MKITKYALAAASGLIALIVAIPTRADAIYTVTEAGNTQLAIPATQFSFIEPTIAASGVTTSVSQISGATVSEFSWNTNGLAPVCNVAGFPFGPGNTCIWFGSPVTLIAVEAFPAGAFTSSGTFSSLRGDLTVSIVTTPEPGSLLLLGAGLLGLVGARRKFRLA